MQSCGAPPSTRCLRAFAFSSSIPSFLLKTNFSSLDLKVRHEVIFFKKTHAHTPYWLTCRTLYIFHGTTQSPVSFLVLHLDLNCSLFHWDPGPRLLSWVGSLLVSLTIHPLSVSSDASPWSLVRPALSRDGNGWKNSFSRWVPHGQSCQRPKCRPPATDLSTWRNVLDPDTEPEHFRSSVHFSLKLKFQQTLQAKWCRSQQ